jgi:hypothetical protein
MSTLKVNKIIPTAGVPTGGGGGIIQVVQTLKTNVFSSANTSFTDISGMAVTITPTSNTSKILISVTMNYGGQNNMYGGINLLRGSTIVAIGDDQSNNNTECTFGIGGDDNNFRYKLASSAYTFLDSPATTSATTYKLQVKAQSSSQRVTINVPLEGGYETDTGTYVMRGTSTITAMEVSA